MVAIYVETNYGYVWSIVLEVHCKTFITVSISLNTYLYEVKLPYNKVSWGKQKKKIRNIEKFVK